MTAVGLIFSNIHDNTIPEVTRSRTLGSVPFGGRYRLIDFTLSSMVNSGISKDWDLARRSGGIKILPPYITSFENAASGKFYSSRLEALMGTVNFLNRCDEDYVVMSDCDVICNIDLTKVIDAHIESDADITFIVKKADVSGHNPKETVYAVEFDENNNLTEIAERKINEGVSNIYINMMVVKRDYLLNVIQDAIAHGYKSFLYDIIIRNVGKENYKVYNYDGWYAQIGSLESYFECSMKLLDNDARARLFGVKNYPVLTKVRNSAPTRYCEGAKVVNSVVAEGCIIEGTVENSIIFRGVHVGKGAVVKNSILFQDSYVCPDATLNCVIADKNVMVKNGRNLSGHSSMPFYIGKNVTV